MPSEGRAPPRDYKICIQDITATLIACGYYSLDAQAKALGINRSTAWTIVRNKHKLGRLSAKTTERMLSNGALPRPSVWYFFATCARDSPKTYRRTNCVFRPERKLDNVRHPFRFKIGEMSTSFQKNNFVRRTHNALM
jgi:hypothetical protein